MLFLKCPQLIASRAISIYLSIYLSIFRCGDICN